METASFSQNNNTVYLRVHRAAWLPLYTNYGQLKLLSAVGPKSSVTGVGAMLRSGKCTAVLDGTHCTPGDQGWRCHTHLLHRDCWHLLAVSKDDHLLVSNTQEHLWAMLRSDRFTTPILKDWMPALHEKLIEKKVIVPLAGFNHNAAVAHFEDELLDTLVADGVKRKVFLIPRRSA